MSILGSSSVRDDWSQMRHPFEDVPIEIRSVSDPASYIPSGRTSPHLHRSSDPPPFHEAHFDYPSRPYPSSEPSPGIFGSPYRPSSKDKEYHHEKSNIEHEDCQFRLKKSERDLKKCRSKTKKAEEKAESRGVRLFHCLKEAKKYEDAEKIYHEILESRDPTKSEDEPFLQLKHSFAAMLFQQNKPSQAEPISRAVLESRRQSPDPSSEAFKESHRQLCSILCAIGKHKEAENMHRSIYQGETMDLWTLENGDEVCQRLREQREFTLAMEMQGQVWEARRKLQICRDGSTVQSGLQFIKDLEKLVATIDTQIGTDAERRFNAGIKQSYESKIEIVLSKIWSTREHPESNVSVLDAGQKYGCALYSQNNFSGAETTFKPVWDGKRHKFGDKHTSTVSTGIMLGKTLCRQGEQEKYREAAGILQGILQNGMISGDAESLSGVECLAQAYLSLEQLPNAEHIFEWILRQKSAMRGISAQEVEDARWNLGRTLCMQGDAKNREAENVLRDLYKQWKTSSPTSEMTLQCGQMLAQSILTQKDKTDLALHEALNVALDVFIGRGRSAEKGMAYLDSAHLYGSLLIEAKDYPEAERTLKSVWEHQVEGAQAQKSWSKCGHLYGRALSQGRKYKEAKSVLETVIKTLEANAGEIGEIRETRELLEKVIGLQKGKEKKRNVARRGRSLTFSRR